MILVFASCAVPVYSWSIVAFLQKLPSWLLSLSLWELAGAFAYTEVFALLESLLLLLGVVLLCVALPPRFFRDRFVAQSSMTVFVTSAWVVVLQFNIETVRLWTLRTLLMWLVLYLVSIGVSYILVHRYRRLEECVTVFVERLVVLLCVYAPVTILSAAIIALRNVQGSV